MKLSFAKLCKIAAAIFALIDFASIILTVKIWTSHSGGGVLLAYFIFQSTFFSIVLLGFFYFIKPAFKKLLQACDDFEQGKTLSLEIHPDELRWFPEWNSLIRKLNEVINREDRLLLSHKEAEYLALQNQINPHFLYNTLEAIRGDALVAGLSSLASTAEALASFFRYTISGENILSTVEDELTNIRNYFLIQRYRFGENLKLEIVFIDKEEEIRKLRIPKLTLQPIVENCVFHGLETKENKGTIKISFDQTQKFLFISVKDDGIGMSQEELDSLNASLVESPFRLDREENRLLKKDGGRHTGIALKNVSQRIKLLFGNEYGITIYSALGVGTNVKIVLPRQLFVEKQENR